MVETQKSDLDECSRPRLRSRVKPDKPSASSTTSSSDSLDTRPALKKQKTGRPIAYKGDPDSKALTETERRKIKRQIANRESARRMRGKRAGTLEELQIEMDHLTERNFSLLRHVAEAEGANAAVKSQLQQFHQKLRHVQGNNSLLQQQNAFLQKKQQQQQQQKAKPSDSTHMARAMSRSFCGDSQELLLDGKTSGFGAPGPFNMSGGDMAYLDNCDNQQGQSLVFT